MPTPTISCPTRAPSTAEAMASTMPSAVPGVGTLWVERMLPSSSTTPAAIFVPPMSTPMVSPDRKSVVQGKSVDLGGRRLIKKKSRITIKIGVSGFEVCPLPIWDREDFPFLADHAGRDLRAADVDADGES